jgi:acyl carrier protein
LERLCENDGLGAAQQSARVSLVRVAFVGGALEKLRMSRTEISQACIDSLAEILRIPADRIDPNTKFDRLGLDSGMSVFLLLSLEERLAVSLVPDAIYEYPTVAQLCEHLAERYSAE